MPTTDLEVFGPYEVYERLGVGGMATVHRAKERGIEGFERIIALKRLLPHLAEDESFVRAFVREAKLASMLQHANIVQLYELGRVGSVYFISMEYIEGRDIRKILRQSRKAAGPPPLPVFLSLMSQLCDALDYAHRRTDQHGDPLGLVHRDVSPSNLIITHSGHLKIIDFGIAKAQSQHLRTQTGRVKGKLAYMAPEAVRGHELDARSDIFAAGVIAHELLTARPLFASKNDYQTIVRVQRAEIEPPSAHNPECPPELDEIVLAALARDPDARWQSAADLRDALHEFASASQMRALSSDVATWMSWAFSLDAPETGSFTTLGSESGSASSISPLSPAEPQRAFARSGSQTDAGAQTGSRAARSSSSLPAVKPPSGTARPSLPTKTQPIVFERIPEHIGEPVPVPREDEEHIADLAWGGHEEDRPQPVLLDEVPDVSNKAIPIPEPGPGPGPDDDDGDDFDENHLTRPLPWAPDRTRDHKERATSEFGAGIMAGKDRRTRGGLVWAGALGLVAVGVAAYLIVSGDPGKDTGAMPRLASLKFMIEPSDATIGVMGHGTHQGSPYGLDVAAPGTYRVEITRQGYKSYVTELEVEGGEKNVVRVALQPATQGTDRAQVVVRSSPDGQRVFLDGAEQAGRTPATLDMAPGAHVLVIQDPQGNELWRQELEAAANTQYEFLAALEDPTRRRRREERRRRREREREIAAAPVAQVAGPSLPGPGAGASITSALESVKTPGEPAGKGEAGETTTRSSGLAGVQAGSTVSRIEPAAGADLTIKSEAQPGRVSRGKSEAARADVAGAQARPERATTRDPVTVAPQAVRKLSGSLPSIAGRGSDVPSRASAKLCIDAGGKVVSANVLTEMLPRPRTELRRALKSWRYAPYRQNGVAVPVCFAVNFTVEVAR